MNHSLPKPLFFDSHSEFKWGDFEPCFESAWDPAQNGHIPMWSSALGRLPNITPSFCDLNNRQIVIGASHDAQADDLKKLEQQLRSFIPWRKGPFNFFGIHLDSEWQSWMKWERLQPKISPLKNKKILDVGCGNGYYMWRMLGEEAECVVGIEPYILYSMQYLAIQHYLQTDQAVIIPTILESLPPVNTLFDTVFSMGVIYHAKDPLAHLKKIATFLHDRGEFILETLVVTNYPKDLLIPKGRYAQMRNVSCIPSVQICEKWLTQAGFKNIRLADISQTGFEEQRVTSWMRFHSLENYLNPENHELTVEGYPAPKRAIMICEKA